MNSNLHELYTLEKLSRNNTCVHRLHPAVKLLTAVVFTVTVVSHTDIVRLLPYVFYPTLLMALSETPYKPLLKRLLLAMPFCLFAGISNIIFAPEQGVIPLLTVLFKAHLCVMAVLLLVAVTPLSELTLSMRRMGVPGIFVTIFEMTYRYISVLFNETYTMYTAYVLRGRGKGVRLRDAGSFIGQLLLRSFDRAERVYNAMKCRGYSMRETQRSTRKFKIKDIIYLTAVCVLCVALRIINIEELLQCLL